MLRAGTTVSAFYRLVVPKQYVHMNTVAYTCSSVSTGQGPVRNAEESCARHSALRQYYLRALATYRRLTSIYRPMDKYWLRLLGLPMYVGCHDTSLPRAYDQLVYSGPLVQQEATTAYAPVLPALVQVQSGLQPQDVPICFIRRSLLGRCSGECGQ